MTKVPLRMFTIELACEGSWPTRTLAFLRGNSPPPTKAELLEALQQEHEPKDFLEVLQHWDGYSVEVRVAGVLVGKCYYGSEGAPISLYTRSKNACAP